MRVLVADAHEVARLGIKSMLEKANGIRVVAEATSAEEAVRLAAEVDPDLVVLDPKLKGLACGAVVCQRIKALRSAPCVLVYSAHGAPQELATAVLAGADGYVDKGAEHVDLAGVAVRLHAGERVCVVAGGPEEGASPIQVPVSHDLTARELEVLALLRLRYSNDEIAGKLYISLQTTKNHVSSIFRKLGLKSRKDLHQHFGTSSRASRVR